MMIINLNKRFAYYSLFVLGGLSAILTSTVAKPSINFSLKPLTQDYVERKNAQQMKTYR